MAATPAWAAPKDAAIALFYPDISARGNHAGAMRDTSPMRESYRDLTRSTEAFSGVVVFPVQVGGFVVSELIHSAEIFPEVVVFPIQVAGFAVSGLTPSAGTFPEVAVFPVHAATTVTVTPARPDSKTPTVSGAGTIAVIYPEIGEPYRSVFAQIIEGIEAKAKGRVVHLAIGPNLGTGELNDLLRRQDAKVVIALGRQGMKAASALNSSNIGIVVGGILTAPENEIRGWQVNSLSPDPALLFSRLKGMMPDVRRVLTVYDPRQNTWMMRLAKAAARAQGLELVAYEAQDLRGAIHAYHEILTTADNRRDALWLPQDSTTVEESAVLPLVLHESWKRNLAVFSSSLSHVKRGVLFSLYPNNVELGYQLAGSALGLLASGENGGGNITPLREVLMAINLRTAKHLDIDDSRQQKFDTAFPEP